MMQPSAIKLLVVALLHLLYPEQVKETCPCALFEFGAVERAPTESCAGRVTQGRAWQALSNEERETVIGCVAREEWFANSTDNDNTAKPPESHCDVLMRMRAMPEWHGDDPVRHFLIYECVADRLALRQIKKSFPALAWLPDTLFTDDLVEQRLLVDLVHLGLVAWQQHSDQWVAAKVFLSPEYAAQWHRLGLDVSHYTEFMESLRGVVHGGLEGLHLPAYLRRNQQSDEESRRLYTEVFVPVRDLFIEHALRYWQRRQSTL